MFIVVGLGNPGHKYEHTRHNVGATLLNDIAYEAGAALSQHTFQSLTTRALWKNFDIFFMAPQTYMNLSGEAVKQALNFFKLSEKNLIVIFDDLDQPFGAVKTRYGGGHGGHNGIRSILDHISSDKFHRIKIGIGKPEHKSATADWVLSSFSSQENSFLLKESFPTAKKRLLDTLKQYS